MMFVTKVIYFKSLIAGLWRPYGSLQTPARAHFTQFAQPKVSFPWKIYILNSIFKYNFEKSESSDKPRNKLSAFLFFEAM